MNTTIEKKVTGKKVEKKSNANSISIKAIESKVVAEKIAENAKANEVKKAPEPVEKLTLEQKIEKVENLKTLVDKRERLEMSRKKLQSFVVGANQFSENIVLTDENGNTFKTSNSEVFTKVVEAINTTLVSKISEIEQQIEF